MSFHTGFFYIKSVSLQVLYIFWEKKNNFFSPGGRPNTTQYLPKTAVESRQYVGSPKTPLHNWLSGARREPMESIGEFQANRKPVESLDDDLVVPSTEHHISLKENDFRKFGTTEKDFVLPYGWHASIWLSLYTWNFASFFTIVLAGQVSLPHSSPAVFFICSGISVNSGLHYDRLAVRAGTCTVYGFPSPPFPASTGSF